jgi:hypothetical protein
MIFRFNYYSTYEKKDAHDRQIKHVGLVIDQVSTHTFCYKKDNTYIKHLVLQW